MKLHIYGEDKKKEDVVLRLIKSYDGYVTLCVVDEDDGEILLSGHLLSITPNMEIKRHTHINKEFGFKQDNMGRIIIE